MFILSLKKKILFIILLILCLILSVFFISKKAVPKPTTANCEWGEYNLVVNNKDDIISFLSQFGFEVDKKNIICNDIKIPSVWNDTYTSYNEIQKKQGLDLTNYMGKDCQKYNLKITNYPDSSCDIIATVIIFQNRVIGGDISETIYNGFTKSFIES